MTREERAKLEQERQKRLAALGNGYGLQGKIVEAKKKTEPEGKGLGLIMNLNQISGNSGVDAPGIAEGLRVRMIENAYNTKRGYNPGHSEYYTKHNQNNDQMFGGNMFGLGFR